MRVEPSRHFCSQRNAGNRNSNRRYGLSCFLLLPGNDSNLLHDQGAHLTADDARTLYERTHRGAAFVDAYLDPVGPRAVLARMLANLVHSFGTRAPLAAVWALKLRLAIPDLPDHERDDGERLLARLKAYSN